jgi:hypothetical protein
MRTNATTTEADGDQHDTDTADCAQPGNQLAIILADPVIDHLLARYAHDIHRIFRSPADVTFVKCWHSVGAKPVHKDVSKYVVHQSLWHTLRPLGILAMLAHYAGSQCVPWDVFRTRLEWSALHPQGIYEPGSRVGRRLDTAAEKHQTPVL